AARRAKDLEDLLDLKHVSLEDLEEVSFKITPMCRSKVMVIQSLAADDDDDDDEYPSTQNQRRFSMEDTASNRSDHSTDDYDMTPCTIKQEQDDDDNAMDTWCDSLDTSTFQTTRTANQGSLKTISHAAYISASSQVGYPQQYQQQQKKLPWCGFPPASLQSCLFIKRAFPHKLQTFTPHIHRLPFIFTFSVMGVSGFAACIKETPGVLATGQKQKEVHVDALSLYYGLITARSFSTFSKAQKTVHPQEAAPPTTPASTSAPISSASTLSHSSLFASTSRQSTKRPASTEEEKPPKRHRTNSTSHLDKLLSKHMDKGTTTLHWDGQPSGELDKNLAKLQKDVTRAVEKKKAVPEGSFGPLLIF
ncbi:hypothetical protein BGZ65_000964, partial [Modicella reniformis]